MAGERGRGQGIQPWQREIFEVSQSGQIAHVSYVPDGGHKGPIALCRNSQKMKKTVLTTEEEGVGLAAGLWLGGQRSVLPMQSSGVGNCVNTFALTEACRIPLLLLVTMRGEFAEYIPFQIPMGKRTPDILNVMGFEVYRAQTSDEVADIVSGALDQAFLSNRAVAVLLSLRMIGRKNWTK
ncbi:MAG: phosphonopyruvate decarboxylase [Pseudomonadota bacterium]